MKPIQKKFLLFAILIIVCSNIVFALTENSKQKINILVLTERGGQHESFTAAAINWLYAEKENLNISYTELNDTKAISQQYLLQFQLILQLDYPPYGWTPEAEKAFIGYIDEGLGGWIGFHHATLLGEFDGFPLWNWFSDFMGGIRFQNYIAQLADGNVYVEDSIHPVMKGVSRSFVLSGDEWYTFDKSPRAKVHVLANVDESSYQPATDIKMGDHPAIWVNPSKKARNVYFLMGHSNKLFASDNFKIMFANAIKWAGSK